MLQQTIYDMITMSIPIVPVIDNYITKFIDLDKSIPQMFVNTKKIIYEYLNENSTVRLIKSDKNT